MTIFQTLTGPIYRERAENVYPLISSASCSLAHIDGPYGIGKAQWDQVSNLAEWYRPHIVEWNRILKPSASLYHWGTAESWAAVHPVYLETGWVFRALVVWDKGPGGSIAMKSSPDALRTWPDVTEVAGFYQRDGCAGIYGAATMISHAAGADSNNSVRAFICAEWLDRGLKRTEADVACNVGFVASRHYFASSQWEMPTWERYQQLADYAHRTVGSHDDGRPPFVLQSIWERGGGLSETYSSLRETYDNLRASYDSLRASYEELRARYDEMRSPFQWPKGVSNVWHHPVVGGGERMLGADGQVLHPCQKPLQLVKRAILASSRPGDTVLAPFGGTCREAVVCESLFGTKEARRHITIEMDTDGMDYVPTVHSWLEERKRLKPDVSATAVSDEAGQLSFLRRRGVGSDGDEEKGLA